MAYLLFLLWSWEALLTGTVVGLIVGFILGRVL